MIREFFQVFRVEKHFFANAQAGGSGFIDKFAKPTGFI